MLLATSDSYDSLSPPSSVSPRPPTRRYHLARSSFCHRASLFRRVPAQAGIHQISCSSSPSSLDCDLERYSSAHVIVDHLFSHVVWDWISLGAHRNHLTIASAHVKIRQKHDGVKTVSSLVEKKAKSYSYENGGRKYQGMVGTVGLEARLYCCFCGRIVCVQSIGLNANHLP